MLTIGYIGSGAMVEALVNGWQGNTAIAQIGFAEAKDQPDGLEHRASVLEVWQDADMVILAENAKTLTDLAPQTQMAASVDPSVIVVSINEELMLAQLHDLISSEVTIARAVPNVNVASHAGYIGLAFDEQIDAEIKGAIAMLFDELGRADEYPEDQLAVVSVLGTAGPALVANLVDALAHTAVANQVNVEHAVGMAEQILAGTGTHLEQAQISPNTLVKQATSDNSVAQTALEYFDSEALMAGLQAEIAAIQQEND
ncbi:pyrroline-5-carboxylate reductase [Weissella uvarum]|uniref:pyrroline-5-carboxylate reductase family protein n=1 Tax=Weissella uvarum TaxID=1479233 RepID=UPI001961815C|nr:pyrroline-5-carboxylate reductase dimerization domain-containing protein [Weissella uvarum]MBM7617703.1 pyrroline-5-carboxylate reductase [Weissella uvarum]MCM0596052.1 pyrroline-5-carboxylate reductase [Weissella uvarum]